MGWTLPGRYSNRFSWRLGRVATVTPIVGENLIHKTHWILPGSTLDFAG
jgi:hypothetical protein